VYDLGIMVRRTPRLPLPTLVVGAVILVLMAGAIFPGLGAPPNRDSWKSFIIPLIPALICLACSVWRSGIMKTVRGWMLAVFLAAFVLSIIARFMEDDRRATVQNRQSVAKFLAAHIAVSLEKSAAFEARALSEKDGPYAENYRKLAVFYRQLAAGDRKDLDRLASEAREPLATGDPQSSRLPEPASASSPR
jgi:hypothetical protein